MLHRPTDHEVATLWRERACQRRPGANRRGLRGFGGAAAPAWTPLEQLGSDLLLFSHAVDSTYSGGTWQNLGADSASINLAQGTAAARPTMTAASTPNGKQALVFDGSDDQLATALRASGVAQPFTVWTVIMSSTTTNSKYPVSGQNTTDRHDIGVDSGTQFFGYAGGAVVKSGATTVLDTWHLVLVVFNGASTTVYVDNAAGTPGNAGAHTYQGAFVGSAFNTAGTFWAGKMAEVGIVQKALSASERASLYAYAQREWGI